MQAQYPSFAQTVDELLAFLIQVRDLDKIRKDVVAVESHQEVGVEKESRQATQNHDVHHMESNHGVARITPHERRDRRQQDFGVHPCRSHCDPFPL